MATKAKQDFSNTITEYVIREGAKGGIFSHSSRAVCAAKLMQLIAEDSASGRSPRDLKIVERTVEYDADSVPVGEDSHNVGGKVTENFVKGDE